MKIFRTNLINFLSVFVSCSLLTSHDVENLINEIDRTVPNLDKIDNVRKSIYTKLHSIKENLKAYEDESLKLKNLTDKINSEKESIKKMDSEIKKLNGDIIFANADVNNEELLRLREEAAEAEFDFTSTEEKIIEIKQKMGVQVKDLKIVKSNLEKEVESLNKEIRNSKSQLEDAELLKERLESQKNDLSNYNNEKIEYDENVMLLCNLNNENTIITGETLKLEKTLKKLNEDVKKSEEEIKKLHKSIETFKKNSKDNETNELEIKKLETQISELKNLKDCYLKIVSTRESISINLKSLETKKIAIAEAEKTKEALQIQMINANESANLKIEEFKEASNSVAELQIASTNRLYDLIDRKQRTYSLRKKLAETIDNHNHLKNLVSGVLSVCSAFIAFFMLMPRMN